MTSKRLRYEILRRDNHACRYCGEAAPAAKLTVDHVVPIALGGSDDPSNLVAACVQCNVGKSSSNPDQPLVSSVSDDAIRWSRAMKAATALQRQQWEPLQEYVEVFDQLWGRWRLTNDKKQFIPRDYTWRQSIMRFFELGLELDRLAEAVEIAMNSKAGVEGTWKYFCGICWKVLRERVEIAQELASRGEVGLAHDLEDDD